MSQWLKTGSVCRVQPCSRLSPWTVQRHLLSAWAPWTWSLVSGWLLSNGCWRHLSFPPHSRWCDYLHPVLGVPMTTWRSWQWLPRWQGQMVLQEKLKDDCNCIREILIVICIKHYTLQHSFNMSSHMTNFLPDANIQIFGQNCTSQ